jgi:RNA polymerase sigma-70 factor, ECF subfamily
MSQTEIKKKKFSKIVLNHFSAMRRFALSLCRNEFDADDLVSETIVKAYDNFQRLNDESKSKQWLFRILNNQFIDKYRSRKVFVEIESREFAENDAGAFSLFESLGQTNFVEHGNPEKKFISKLTQQDIRNAIQELPVEFRQVMILCDVEEFTYAEISKIVNVPIGTVRSRISRARIILQKKLWLHAKDFGIKKVKEIQVKEEYTCTCGKEEVKKVSSILA